MFQSLWSIYCILLTNPFFPGVSFPDGVLIRNPGVATKPSLFYFSSLPAASSANAFTSLPLSQSFPGRHRRLEYSVPPLSERIIMFMHVQINVPFRSFPTTNRLTIDKTTTTRSMWGGGVSMYLVKFRWAERLSPVVNFVSDFSQPAVTLVCR